MQFLAWCLIVAAAWLLAGRSADVPPAPPPADEQTEEPPIIDRPIPKPLPVPGPSYPAPPDISSLKPYRPPTLAVYSRKVGCSHCLAIKAALRTPAVQAALVGWQVRVYEDFPGVSPVPLTAIYDADTRLVPGKVWRGRLSADELVSILRGGP